MMRLNPKWSAPGPCVYRWCFFLTMVLGIAGGQGTSSLLGIPSSSTSVRAQEPQGAATGDEERDAENAALAALAAARTQDGIAGGEKEDTPSGIDLLTLFASGGALMWPIVFMSLFVVTVAIERIVSFRMPKMLPRELVSTLGRLVQEGKGTLDAEAALKACQEYPSSASRIVTAMLMRLGRPLDEIELAAGEAAQREADLQAGPVRWLNFAAAATPLMGLLGTVWGMIVAFHNSATLTAERSRSEQLSEGIYTALVTTLAGLAVAIPAAILAQYLENRLGKIYHKIELLTFSLAPTLEHYAGKFRMSPDAKLQRIAPPPDPTAPPPAAVVIPSNDSRNPSGRTTSSSSTAKKVDPRTSETRGT